MSHLTVQERIDKHLAALERLYWTLNVQQPTGERLTNQELRVCTLAVSGLTDGQIAVRLHYSEDRVGAVLRDAYRKLGIRKRAQLAQALARQDDR